MVETNKTVEMIVTRSQEIAKNGQFSLKDVTDVETLSAVAKLSESVVNSTQLWQAKALQKIREIFAREKRLVSARNKARDKNSPRAVVNIYGYGTFVDYAEKVLSIPKSTANTLANLARLLDETGLHSVFYGKFGDLDFGFAQLLKISPYYKTDENGNVTENPVEKFALNPAMTVKEIGDILSGKMLGESTETADESTETADESTETADETAKEETPKEYALKLTTDEIALLSNRLQFAIANETNENVIMIAGKIIKKIEKAMNAKK